MDYANEMLRLEEEILSLKKENLSLKARLSRVLNPDNPNYTDEEMDAMCSEFGNSK